MRKYLIFCLISLFCFQLSAETILTDATIKLDQDSTFVVTNYRVKSALGQGLIYGSIGAAAGVGLYLFYPDDYGIGLVIYPSILGSVGLISGALYGYNKKVPPFKKIEKKHHKFVKKRRRRYGLEFGSTYGIFLYSEFTKQSLVCRLDNLPDLYPDEFRITSSQGYISARYNDDRIYYEINKFEINGIYKMSKTLVSPYYGLGLGYAQGESEKRDFKSFVFRPMIGLSIDVFGILYIRSNFDFEFFSTGRENLQIVNEYGSKPHITFSLMFGSYLF